MRTFIFALNLLVLFIDIALYKLNIIDFATYIIAYVFLALIAIYIAKKEEKYNNIKGTSEV